MANKNLNAAKLAKNDEFYTQMNDIAAELYHYRHHFVGKKIFLNCDDPRTSNFWQYFELNFDELKLEKLTSTHYDPEEPTYKLEMTRGVDVNSDGVIDQHDIIQTPLVGNGDFRSAECIELLDEADIVITNPPFSLWREYIAQLIEHDKKFIIIGTQNAVSTKEVFPLFQENKIWLGYGFRKGNAYFKVPDGSGGNYAKGVYDPDTGLVKFRNCAWFTNLDIDKRHDKLTLWKDYKENEEDYPRYVNYDAIEVSKVNEIPRDYYGKMGVPITFLNVYSPDQFKIIGISTQMSPPIADYANGREYSKGGPAFYIADGADKLKRLYTRLVIQRVDQPEEPQEGGDE